MKAMSRTTVLRQTSSDFTSLVQLTRALRRSGLVNPEHAFERGAGKGSARDHAKL